MVLCRVEDLVNGENQPIELLALGSELPAACDCERIEASATVIFGRAPLGLDPAIEEEPLQRGIERALANLQYVLGNLSKALRDPVSMSWTRNETTEDQEIECAGQQLRRSLSHR